MLRLSALVLVLVVLPLAIIAAVVDRRSASANMAGRPSASGAWSRSAVAIAYGVAGWWAVVQAAASASTSSLRPLQTRLALGLCGLALLLALPIVDFGAISARSQMARLAAGRSRPAEFDWQAMAFDFGPAGRRAPRRIARGGPTEQRTLAAAALATKNRYDIEAEVAKTGAIANLDRYLRVIPEGQRAGQAARGHRLDALLPRKSVRPGDRSIRAARSSPGVGKATKPCSVRCSSRQRTAAGQSTPT